MVYNEREARKQLPKGDLSHTESYIVVFNAFDPKDGIWKRQSRRYYAPDKDSHEAVQARFMKDMRGKAYGLIELAYE